MFTMNTYPYFKSFVEQDRTQIFYLCNSTAQHIDYTSTVKYLCKQMDKQW